MTTDARSPAEGIAVTLRNILSDMRAIPRANLLTRLFQTIGKPRCMAICSDMGIEYSADPIKCVEALVKATADPAKLAVILGDASCVEHLVRYFSGHHALRKAKATG